jgi:type IV pilus assembly protein PilE
LGFTLIEMMITVVVIAILGAIAYPSFIEQIRKSRRADGIAALNQAMQAQERYRSNNATYADAMSKLSNVVTTSEKGYYTLAVDSASASGYQVTATAAGAQASDAACTALVITMTGGAITYGKSGTGTASACWNR